MNDGEPAYEEPYRVLLRLLIQRDPGVAAQLLREAATWPSRRKRVTPSR